MDYPTRLDFCDGKYTVIYDFSTGQSECLRYGQPWRQLVGDKMVLAMFDRVVELQAENAALKAELAAAQKEAERLDFIIEKALESRTGVTIDYHKYVEDGQVVERGFRMAWFHHLNPRFKTLREAIDAAIDKEMGK